MTKAQEKLLRDLFERSFKVVKSLNYNQVAWILHQVGWLNHFTDDELKEEILKRETDLEIRAPEQEQKQYNLLELYKELANKIEVIDNAYDYGILGFDEIKHICEKIKELENND